uniref:hypothetical protein n=1 Tax=Streptococcus mitis TaxID=28037 RepID=UPI002367C4B3
MLRLVDCEALSLKLNSGLSVLSGTDILENLENDSDTEVLTDADSDTEVLIESEAITLAISRALLEWISGNPLLVTTDADSEADVLAEVLALVEADVLADV